MLTPTQSTSLLVVAPHPDDEIIGCGGLIQTVLSAGGAVDVVIVSDGAASHPGSRSYPARKLAETRRQESRAALAHVGVAPDRIEFLDLPDGGSSDWVLPNRAAQRLKRPVDWVALPSRLDDHPDHRRTTELVTPHLRCRQALHYLVWPITGCPGPKETVRIDIEACRERKAEALRKYRTQLGLIEDSPDGFTITDALFDRFTQPVERFYAR
ncbi:MAG: PIG-L family deacetylase [Litorimonas sp.]